MIQVDFMRQSANGRITLVLDESGSWVRSLWALMDGTQPEAARDALGAREGIPRANWPRHVGLWGTGSETPTRIANLNEWAATNGLDYVIWTNLPAKFNDRETTPPAADVVRHLEGLRGATRRVAEEYVRRAPQQIDTTYRREIEATLGWTATDD